MSCLENSDTFRRMWSTTFEGAIERRNMFITERSLNKTIRYSAKFRFFIFYYFQHLFITYVLCTQFVFCTLFGLLLWQTCIVLVYFQNEQSVSTDHTV